jgi:hypothetical protein
VHFKQKSSHSLHLVLASHFLRDDYKYFFTKPPENLDFHNLCRFLLAFAAMDHTAKPLLEKKGADLL